MSMQYTWSGTQCHLPYFPWIALWLSRCGGKFQVRAIPSSMSMQQLIQDAVLLLYFFGWPYSLPNSYLLWCQCSTWSATQCHFCAFLGLPYGFPEVATNSKSGPFLLRCQCNNWSTTQCYSCIFLGGPLAFQIWPQIPGRCHSSFDVNDSWSATESLLYFPWNAIWPYGFPDLATNSKSRPFLLRCQCHTWSTTRFPYTSYACWAFVLPTL